MGGNTPVLKLAVLGLVLLGFSAMVGSVALLWRGTEAVPDGIIAMGSACVGALATLLVSQRDRGSEG